MSAKITPMMEQWYSCKEKAKNCLLLFRLGDFYEAFHDDAVVLAAELDLTLTKRGDTPMAGIPHHTAEAYIDTLTQKGFRVAVAEQMEEAKAGKGLVRRDIARILTPATSFTAAEGKENNYFASVFYLNGNFGLAVLDLTTGEYKTAEFEEESDLISELSLLKPKEILISKKQASKFAVILRETKKNFTYLLNEEEAWFFEPLFAENFLKQHFSVHSLDGYGLKGKEAAISAAGSLVFFIRDFLSQSIDHIRSLSLYSTKDFLFLDKTTEKNLELLEPLYSQNKKSTLLSILDKTETPMGGRLIRQWIKHPLLSTEKILARQDAVQEIMNFDLASLKLIKDLERLIMKISSNIASPRDFTALKYSLMPISTLKETLSSVDASLLKVLVEELTPLNEAVDILERAIVDEPPFRLSDGGVFKDGYSEELDELRLLSRDVKTWMAEYQGALKEKTGIKTMKVGFAKFSGFYIEVSRGQTDKVPENFQRKQTLTNGERYTTRELKEYEEKILSAEEKTAKLEQDLFRELKEKITPFLPSIIKNAKAIACLDALKSLSVAASLYGYVKPEVNESFSLEIIGGRHPVIETLGQEAFISNDAHLDYHTHSLMLITGPNMAGKSTYIRQIALIVLMAHIGSFVPAKTAKMGLVDKIYTRIGASDDLSRGQSTFMVEMSEAANILHNATARSLVILDEIGRGTSTYDGISLAWSVAEYLLLEKKVKTFYATHFWELTKLEEKVPGAINYTIAVQEKEGALTFLRKIIRGGTDKSYGIHVAELAGMPQAVLTRAREILIHLEENSNRKNAFEPPRVKKPKVLKTNDRQLSFLN